MQDLTFSVIIPIYNTEEYIHDLFYSLESQNKYSSKIEIICVNDGSTDYSAEIVKRWRDKYPTSFIYLEQKNSGVAAARNLGIKHATGKWISFIDSDDFVSKNYFESIENIIQHKRSYNLGLIVTYPIIYDQRTRKFYDNFPLRHNFQKGYTWTLASQHENFIINTMTNCFFRKDILEQHSLKVKDDIFPTYEDAEFTAQYLLKIPSMEIGTVPSAKYFARKRSDGSSLSDNVKSKYFYYTSTLANGCQRTIASTYSQLNYVPTSLQQMILHEVSNSISFLLNSKIDLENFENGLTKYVEKMLVDIFSYIDTATIQDSNLPYPLKKGILHSFKQIKNFVLDIDITEIDTTMNEIKIYYFSTSPNIQISFQDINGLITPLYHKIEIETLLDMPFIYKHIFSIPYRENELTILPTSLNIQTTLKCKNIAHADTISIHEIKKLLKA